MSTQKHLLLTLLVLTTALTLAGCPETVLVHPDAGPDASSCISDEACSGATPHCDTTNGICVACTGDAHCTGTPATPHCGSNSSCAECASDAHCPTAAAAACIDGTCTGCTADTQCTRFAATPACDEVLATCATACTPGNEMANCGTKSCDPVGGVCTPTTRETVGVCRQCRSDSECVADHRCIPMEYMGDPRPSAYCLRRLSAGCTAPYLGVVKRMSLSGAIAEDYCAPAEALTTCEAILDLQAGKTCTAATEGVDCGHPDLADDGRCETVGAVNNVCTYSCGTSNHCPVGVTCNSGYCGAP